MATHEEKPWPPTGINLSAYKDLAVAADKRTGARRAGLHAV